MQISYKKYAFNGYKRSNLIKDYHQILNIINSLKPYSLRQYLLEFEEVRLIKSRKYLDNCKIKEDKCYLVIEITHNKCIFFANNRILKP